MEYFRTFDESGAPRALMLREEVHRLGLWHKSAQVLIFNSAGAMLLQHRAADKDLYADMWDFAVGEHLLPDEEFLAGAKRGLSEELGVDACDLTPLGESVWLQFTGEGFIDREIQQGFFGICDGPFKPDPVEIQALRFVTGRDLRVWLRTQPDQFTPWFHEQWPQRKSLLESFAVFK